MGGPFADSGVEVSEGPFVPALVARPVGVVCLMLAAAAAGCVAGSHPPAAGEAGQDPDPTAAPATKDGATCALQGFTTDDESRALAGVGIRLLKAGQTPIRSGARGYRPP